MRSRKPIKTKAELKKIEERANKSRLRRLTMEPKSIALLEMIRSKQRQLDESGQPDKLDDGKNKKLKW